MNHNKQPEVIDNVININKDPKTVYDNIRSVLKRDSSTTPIVIQVTKDYQLTSILDKYSLEYHLGHNFDWKALKNVFITNNDIKKLPICISYLCDKKTMKLTTNYASYHKLNCSHCDFTIIFRPVRTNGIYDMNKQTISLDESQIEHKCQPIVGEITIDATHSWLLEEHPLFLQMVREQYYQYNQEKAFLRSNVCSILRNSHGINFNHAISQPTFSRVFQRVKKS